MYSYVFFFILLLSVLLIFSRIDAFRFLDEHGESREVNLDGLRAFLAIFVFYHHLTIKYYTIATGKGPYSECTLFNNLGSIGVSMFFMITGYLFWGKLRSGNPLNWIYIFSSRIFRIGPLYLAVMLISCLFILIEMNFDINQENIDNIRGQISTILFLGMDHKPHAFMNKPDFLNFIGPTWTLFYEWLFYFSLPFLFLFASREKVLVLLVSALLFLCTINNDIDGLFFSKIFLLGMISFELKSIKANSFNKNKLLRSSIVLSFIFLSMYFSDGNHVYNNSSLLCLGVSFLLIIRGCSVFGILSSKGATRIGSMSYSIYLTHGVILTLLLKFEFIKRLIMTSDFSIWVITSFSFFVCFIISMISYRFIERKGVELGRVITQKIESRFSL